MSREDDKIDMKMLVDITLGEELQELEPSLNGKQYRILYSRDEVPIKVTFERETTNEVMSIRILMSGEQSDPGEIKLELTSENDLMFCYRMSCTEQTFISLSNENQLTATFFEFPQMLTSLVD